MREVMAADAGQYPSEFLNDQNFAITIGKPDQRWGQDHSLPARSTLWAASALDLGLVPPGEEGGGVDGYGGAE